MRFGAARLEEVELTGILGPLPVEEDEGGGPPGDRAEPAQVRELADRPGTAGREDPLRRDRPDPGDPEERLPGRG